MVGTWAFFQSKTLSSDKVYDWAKINVFTRWISSNNQTGILVFDPADPRPFEDLAPETHLLVDPFWIYPYILNLVSDLEERAVWAIRNQIRPIETGEEDATPLQPNGRPQPNYRKLHDIARHSIHVTETLDVNLQNVDRILENHKAYMTPGYSSPFTTHPDSHAWQKIQSRLSFDQSYLGSLRHRSISNEKRLQNEIQLTFQMVARRDALVTEEISRAMMSDSAALKTLAFVTFAFLPPTFICAVFSMSFFNYDQNLGWRVSGKFWIYWATAVPTTILSAALGWFYWQRDSPRLEQVPKQEREAPLPTKDMYELDEVLVDLRSR